MKQKISYSSVMSGLSIAFFVVFVAIFVLFWVFINKPFDNVFFWILFGLFCLGICWIFGSIPDSVSADDDYVGVHRPFKTERYRYNDIKSAEYGRDYSSDEKGPRFHGKYKEPVLITLKDGRRYVIGAEDAKQLADYINQKVS